MIVGLRTDGLRAFFVDDAHSRNILPDLETRLFRKLQMIDDAVTDQEDGERGEADGICLDDHGCR